MSIIGMDCKNCIHHTVCGHSICCFKQIPYDLIASGENVEIRFGGNEPIYSKAELYARDEDEDVQIVEKIKLEHLTLYTEEQLKEIMKDE